MEQRGETFDVKERVAERWLSARFKQTTDVTRWDATTDGDLWWLLIGGRWRRRGRLGFFSFFVILGFVKKMMNSVTFSKELFNEIIII